jgi:hypothetical protein
MADNQFSVRVPNALEALMAGEQGYTGMSNLMTDRAQSEARRLAAQDFASGNTQGALSRLIASGDNKTLQALVQQQAAQGGVFGTPIYGTDDSGNTRIGTFDKSGRFRPIDTPGFTPSPGIKTIDTPQGVNVVNSKSGRPIGDIPQGPPPVGQPQGGVPSQAPLPVRPVQTQSYYPKDVKGVAAQTVEGKEEGTARADLASVRAKLPGLKVVVEQLAKIGDVATYTKAGQLLDYGRTQANLPPRAGAIARTKYIAMVDNQILPMLRDTFGAQFTQKEGESLKTTMGDPEKSPQEKRAVLEAFIEQKVRNIEALELQTSGNKNLTGPGKTITGVDVQTVPAGVVDWRTYFGASK